MSDSGLCPSCHEYIGNELRSSCPNCGANFGSRDGDYPNSDDE